MLEHALDGTSLTEFNSLYDEFVRINRQHNSLATMANDLDDRRNAIMEQMRVIAASGLVGETPEPMRRSAEKLIAAINDAISERRNPDAAD